MKRSLLSTMSALVIVGSIIPGMISSAQAQMTMHFSAPFISDSGLVNASADQHFITLAVTGFPLESLLITLPDDLRKLDGATVTDGTGKKIASNVAIAKGSITVSFPQPVQPNTYLTIRLSGVTMDNTGGTALYRVTAMKQGLKGPLPIGTAMVRLRDRT